MRSGSDSKFLLSAIQHLSAKRTRLSLSHFTYSWMLREMRSLIAGAAINSLSRASGSTSRTRSQGSGFRGLSFALFTLDLSTNRLTLSAMDECPIRASCAAILLREGIEVFLLPLFGMPRGGMYRSLALLMLSQRQRTCRDDAPWRTRPAQLLLLSFQHFLDCLDLGVVFSLISCHFRRKRVVA